VLAFLAEEGLLQSDDVSVARPASLRALLRVHSAEYLETLSRPEVALRIFGLQLGDAEAERVLRTQRLMVGGTIQATRLVLAHGGVAVNLGGGFHHAEGQRGQAFCMVNDVAVAIARLRAQGLRAPVLVVDLDLHDGNGTRAVFADDPTSTRSVAAEHWETRGRGVDLDRPRQRVTDEVRLGTLLKTLPDVVESFAPGLVVHVAGTDPAADDALGNWHITDHGMLSRDRLSSGCFTSAPPAADGAVLGGGYGEGAWRYTARMAAWLLSRRVVEPLTTTS
jgi:acetoin utilization deacetylase AcuC-like enzyme